MGKTSYGTESANPLIFFSAMKKIYVESLGCAKNQVDSEILLSLARKKGYEITDSAQDADVVVINTCGFIESAKKEAIDTFFSFRNALPQAKIVLAGCLAERYFDELELPEADALFGNHDLSFFPELLDKLENAERGTQVRLHPETDRTKSDCERTQFLSRKGSVYLKISEGCNHRCNYCAIPLIRGPLASRSREDIINEARALIERGYYEINIVAQDLGAWGSDLYGAGDHFTSLMKELASLDGDFVLRMLYIHPDTFPVDLIQAVKENRRILPYFDIPFQHSWPGVLRGMKRSGDRETYAGLVRKIREALPDAVIRTTLMLGFPGEDEEAFEDLVKFVKEAEFDWMGSFLYSREEDTPAYSMRGEREHKRAQKQAALWQKELENVQSEITARRLERFVGGTYTALVEEPIQGEDLAIARIYSQAPDVDGLTVIMGEGLKEGDVVRVGIRAVRGLDLEAVLINE